ncbi:MAG: LLM class flavin-dependent oxidoreductase [Asgard group archaeon]|nr:LLM class flavin-dependent oxidoreductase [Asgard group archaeon]
MYIVSSFFCFFLKKFKSLLLIILLYPGDNKLVKSLEFGVFTGQVIPFKELVQAWKHCEKIGFDSIWVADHFAHWNKSLEPFWECWTTLAALAFYTSKIRFGATISNMTWRHPAWLARLALTVDHMSNGRLIIGLGTGRHDSSDQKWLLHNNWETKERVERFREYVEIVDLLLRNPITTFKGKYYHVNEAPMGPECVQKPRPPILIGTKGRKMLKIVSHFADVWNCMAFFGENLEDKSFDDIKEKNNLLDKYCNNISRDPKDIRRSLMIYEVKPFNDFGLMDLYHSPDVFEEIVKKYVKIGFNEILIAYPVKKEDIPLFEKITQEVIPKLREKY